MLRPAARPINDFLRQAIALALLTPFAVYCHNPTELEARRDELARHRAMWEAQHVTSYRYTLSRSCECLFPQMTGPAVVEVRSGNLTAQLSGGAAADTSLFTRVEGLFAVVQRAIDENAETLTVEYDPVLGYPKSIGIDYRKEMVDDEFTVILSGFQLL